MGGLEVSAARFGAEEARPTCALEDIKREPNGPSAMILVRHGGRSTSMPRFLVAHRLALRAPGDTWREELTRLARAAREVGVRPIETFYSADRSLAYTLYEAADGDSIRRLHERAAASPPDDVLRGEQIFTELLVEPRR